MRFALISNIGNAALKMAAYQEMRREYEQNHHRTGA